MAKKATIEAAEPKFPYTTRPGALRRLLKEIPARPKPPRLHGPAMKSWGIMADGNSMSALRVLRKLGILSPTGEPTDAYVEFMKPGTGPRSLGVRIKEQYRPLFEATHAPYKEDSAGLKSLFNIHSGGSPETIDLQVQTFKALSEHADFGGAAGEGEEKVKKKDGVGAFSEGGGGGGGGGLPPIRVDLHIHLPENKSARDYEAIIQDIGKYIYGRTGPTSD